jgi:hypothetical protein
MFVQPIFLHLLDLNLLVCGRSSCIHKFRFWITNSIFITVAAYWGLGETCTGPGSTPQNVVTPLKWAYLAEGTIIVGADFGHISFAVLLLSITRSSKGKCRFLWSIIVLPFVADVTDVAATIVTYAQCQPIQKY